MKLKTHKIFLFDLKNGKKKLGYGNTAEHALKILSYRLNAKEMAEILPNPKIIMQQDMQQYVKDLG